MITVANLRTLASLRDFEDDDLALLLNAGRTRALGAGQILYVQGEPASACFLLVHGSLQIERARTTGSEILTALGPGAFVGQVAMIDRGPRSASVRAKVASEGIELTSDVFDRLLAGSTPLCLAFQDQLARASIRQFRDAMTRLAALPPPKSSVAVRVQQLARARAALAELGAPTEPEPEPEVEFVRDYGRDFRRKR